MTQMYTDKETSAPFSIKKRSLQSLDFTAVDMPYVFCIGGILGTAYEVMLTLCTTGVLENRSGSVLTPFNYVYGVGAVVILLALHKVKKGTTLFAVGAVLGGAVEYGLNYFQEILLGCSSWNYSEKPFNINGRTTLPFMLVWGGLCFMAIRFLFPVLLRAIHTIPAKTRNVIGVVLLSVVCIDAIVSLVAVTRYVQRNNGIFYASPQLQWFDRTFHDTFMRTHFPNMIIN